MLCVAAGVVWLKLDREEKARADEQRQLDAERAEFREHNFAAIKAFHQYESEVKKSIAASNARSAQIQKEIDDEKSGRDH